MPKTLILADDHPLILNGTKSFLESKGYEVIATANDGIDAYNKVVKYAPALVILDFDIPKLNGLEIASELRKNHIETKIVILTLHKHSNILDEVGKTIEGYVTKDSGLEELEACLNAILENRTYSSKNLSKNIHLKENSESSFLQLSSAEVKILRYLSQNLSSAAIADELFISKRTVEKHRSNIIKKIGLDSSNQNALILWLQDHPEILNIS